MTKVKGCRFTALLLVAVGMGARADIRYSPMRVELLPGTKTEAITLTNLSDAKAVIQVEALKWEQRAGRDEYSPTRDLVTAPPVFTLPPRGTQIVRIAVRRLADPEREQAYRLFFQEVTPPPENVAKGVAVRMRVGIPLYLQPQAPPTRQSLNWRVNRTGGVAVVRMENPRNRRVQVNRLTVVDATGKAVSASSGAASVLPGKEFEWKIDLPRSAKGPLRVNASLPGENQDTTVGTLP